jgi:hypothetical protein
VSGVVCVRDSYTGWKNFIKEFRPAIVFLRLNGFDPVADSEKWEELILDVASSKIDREQTTRRLRKFAQVGLILPSDFSETPINGIAVYSRYPGHGAQRAT